MKIELSRSRLFAGLALSLSTCAIVAGCGATVDPLVLGTNTRPTADAGEDVYFEESNDHKRTLSGLASTDLDGDSLTYFWEQTLGPQVEDLEPSANSPVIQFKLPDEDPVVLRFTLTVLDSRGASDNDTVFVFVGEVPVHLEDEDN